jgi:FkbM family methyltransferase
MFTQLLSESIILDILLFRSRGNNLRFKISFLIKKYYLIIKHFFIPFKLGESKVTLLRSELYYDGVFGLAGLQRIFTSHYAMVSKIKDIKTVLDIGANVGYFSYMINSQYPNSKVVAVEPVPFTFKTLSKNLKHFKNTKCLNYAVSSTQGELSMSVDENQSFLGKVSMEGNVKVKAETLDNIFFKNFKQLDLLKIDVEGFEAEVLKGGMSTLKNTKYLMIEVTIKDNTKYSFSSLISMLNSKDFNYQLIAIRSFNKPTDTVDATDLFFKNLKYNDSL